MRDPDGGEIFEADVVINGRRLTYAESLALRVALGVFESYVSDPETAAAVGFELAANYRHHIVQVAKKVQQGIEEQGHIPRPTSEFGENV